MSGNSLLTTLKLVACTTGNTLWVHFKTPLWVITMGPVMENCKNLLDWWGKEFRFSESPLLGKAMRSTSQNLSENRLLILEGGEREVSPCMFQTKSSSFFRSSWLSWFLRMKCWCGWLSWFLFPVCRNSKKWKMLHCSFYKNLLIVLRKRTVYLYISNIFYTLWMYGIQILIKGVRKLVNKNWIWIFLVWSL